MSNVARYLYARTRAQLYGEMTLEDGVMGALLDRNIGPKGELMGLTTEKVVEKYNVTREEQDEVAFRSHKNALATWDAGLFADYVVPVPVPQRKGDPIIFAKDEGPRVVTMEQLAAAKPYFKRDGGTITGPNSSSINDGAAALVLASEEMAAELGIKPLAELISWHNVGVPRELMGEGAFKVIPGLLKRAGMTMGDIDFLNLTRHLPQL